MALRQTTKGKWVYDRTHGRAVRFRITLPENIRTHLQAEEYVKCFYMRKDKIENYKEKFFELIIEKYPSEFINEDNISFVNKPFSLSHLLPDSIFIDKNGNYLVVEIVLNRLDRMHTYKILEYRDQYEKKLQEHGMSNNVRAIMIIIGGSFPISRKIFLDKYNIELKHYTLKQMQQKILKLLSVHKTIT